MDKKKVLAKFTCDSTVAKEGDQTKVEFSAVMNDCEENKSFSRWTPYGKVELLISNETEAAKVFEPGKEYYLTFIEV